MSCIHGSIVGVALLCINNIGAILLSLQPSPVDLSNSDLQKLQSAHVTLISVINFAGKIVIGALVDFLMSRGAPASTDVLGGQRCLPETLTIVSATAMMAGHATSGIKDGWLPTSKVRNGFGRVRSWWGLRTERFMSRARW
ncbi:hypothetical protein M427DRAFT_56438 [Gonapodya prolifera JEL478]|uniref:Uncharacterized protein n=1 Tax=Gonapodya prolifera (strain JEL478) TaxID=1344416 RepID=A0A139AGI9_GONPJ|nr:hypothetical protein M427DRAFT_56438 [Gonapodya prolifera JEL478]|eukprot:KXS15870.1 hypothetical protein M427DRAFT_56438 [Gonapodya prolifera JEL478]